MRVSSRTSRFFLTIAMAMALSRALVFSQSQKATEGFSSYITGGKTGLYSAAGKNGSVELQPLWNGGEVRSIVPSNGGWYFITSEGVVFSPDLKNFENRSGDLPVKILKRKVGEVFSLDRRPVDIMAFAVDPAHSNRLAVCTSSEIWFSDSTGDTWVSLGNPATNPGFKALAFGPRQDAGPAPLWVSHSIKGVFFKDFDTKNGWTNASTGLPKVFGSNVEEVSSFALIPSRDASPTFLAGTSFLGRIYRWDSSKKTFVEKYSDGLDYGAVDSMSASETDHGGAIAGNKVVRFSIDSEGASITPVADAALTGFIHSLADTLFSLYGDSPLCIAAMPLAVPDGRASAFALDELWRLFPHGKALNPDAEARRRKATGKNSLYLQTGFVVDPESRKKYFDLMKQLGLDSLVVDMKDDNGRLRFTPRSPLITVRGTIGGSLDLEPFVEEARSRGIYLVARIVAFKDEALCRWNGGALAVHDAKTGGAWQGTRLDGQPIKEFWVDPYSEDVWRYNVEIAKEVTARGFDEVQFDYIRFPTDGENLADAVYPRKEAGMTQAFALESFLQYARSEISAPISVDIYGTNGWFRSAARTGQDVEMLSKYVDVICPMFYPSHFEQAFMAQAPAGLRPYRIYKLGTLRNETIARDRTLIRPYVQAFYLDVSYDRIYYGTHYVEEEVRGVRDGANQGMTFWNNSGRYSDVPILR